MDRIPRPIETIVKTETAVKSTLKRNALNYAGILVGSFIVLAVIVIVTTDVSLISFDEVANLGLQFFLLLFCAYAMYITFGDSGMRAGLTSTEYTEALAMFEAKRRYIIENGLQDTLSDFCRAYVTKELRSTKSDILAVAGISYETYETEYMTLDKHKIKANTKLSKAQKKAIIEANSIKPIKLTPEMIMKKGMSAYRRSPLGYRPEVLKIINFSTKLILSAAISIGMTVSTVLELVGKSGWVIFTTCMLKLLTVVWNGFSGYKYGFKNIVIHTVNFMSDQVDLMAQAIKYAE